MATVQRSWGLFLIYFLDGTAEHSHPVVRISDFSCSRFLLVIVIVIVIVIIIP